VSQPAPKLIPIESLDDPRVAGYRNVRDGDLRGRDGRFIAESRKIVVRALHSNFEVESLLLSMGQAEALASEIDRLPAAIAVFVASEELLWAISGHHVHGGALALVRRPSDAALSAARRFEALALRRSEERLTVIALANVTHMDNVGSVFRSAAGLGVDLVLLDRRCCDPLLRKPIRVAMGHSLTLPFAWSDDLLADCTFLRRTMGFAIVAAESSDPRPAAPTSVPLPQSSLWRNTPRALCLFGNEGHGLDADLLGASDEQIEIPMAEGFPSLNVAVAMAIAVYERRRAIRSR